MVLEDESEHNPDRSTSSVADTAKKADKALRDTAQSYLKRIGIYK
jgi:hypothetical protein